MLVGGLWNPALAGNNNAAEFVLPTRDGGFAVFADSDEHGFGEGANFALYKLTGDPHR